MTIEKD